MNEARLKDWTDVLAEKKANAIDACRKVATLVQSELNPFVELDNSSEQALGGALNGLPYAAKDMFLCAGRKPTWGLSAPIETLPDDQTADVLKRLDEAGGSRMGFTRMTALAYEPSGVNPLQAAPLNPWNRDFITGASSSGSAVAVAAGAAFVALGSDTGGSVRIPAQGCGVTAWKPTAGWVPDVGAMPLAPSLDAIGLLARSARDILSVAPVVSDAFAGSRSNADSLSIVVLEDAFEASDPAIRECCAAAIVTLKQLDLSVAWRRGMNLVEEGGARALTVMQAEAAAAHNDHLDDPRIEPMLAMRLLKGLQFGRDELEDALQRRSGLEAQTDMELFGERGIIALPVMPIRTPPLAETDPASESFASRTLYALSAFTRFVNYLGLPAVALPVGFDDRGMPVALQLVGRRGGDAALLQVATRFQDVTDWHSRLPTTLLPHQSSYGVLLS